MIATRMPTAANQTCARSALVHFLRGFSRSELNPHLRSSSTGTRVAPYRPHGGDRILRTRLAATQVMENFVWRSPVYWHAWAPCSISDNCARAMPLTRHFLNHEVV